MTARRVALIGTGVAVVVVALLLLLVSQARSVTIAALVSAVAGVAALGIAVWAALRQSSSEDPSGGQPPPGVSVQPPISGRRRYRTASAAPTDRTGTA